MALSSDRAALSFQKEAPVSTVAKSENGAKMSTKFQTGSLSIPERSDITFSDALSSFSKKDHDQGISEADSAIALKK
jgi:hypothetical protein